MRKFLFLSFFNKISLNNNINFLHCIFNDISNGFYSMFKTLEQKNTDKMPIFFCFLAKKKVKLNTNKTIKT